MTFLDIMENAIHVLTILPARPATRTDRVQRAIVAIILTTAKCVRNAKLITAPSAIRMALARFVPVTISVTLMERAKRVPSVDAQNASRSISVQYVRRDLSLDRMEAARSVLFKAVQHARLKKSV